MSPSRLRGAFAALALLAGVGAALLGPAPLSAQALIEDWDPSGLAMSRSDLLDLLQRFESAAASAAYSDDLRASAELSASRIRQRLEEGDMRVGDRIALEVQGRTEWPDTVIVEPGPSIIVPEMEPIDLHGVLRSEVEGHLTTAFSRYIRDPQVRATPLIRISVQGAVGRPGFYVIDSNSLLDDVIMTAGGPVNGRLDEIEILRGEETLMEGDEVRDAMAQGRTLDQLGFRAADQVFVPLMPPPRSSFWWDVGRFALVVASAALLGVSGLF